MINNNTNVPQCSIVDLFKKTILKTENDFILNEDGSCNSSFSSSSGNGRLESPRNSRNMNTSLNNNNNINSNNNSNGGSPPKLQSANGSSNNNNTHIDNSNNSIVQPIKLTINNCRKSNMYILVAIALGTIHSCHDCTIVLGPCSDYIEISECSSVNIISLTKGLRIKSSTNINVNICINQKPIISSDCSDIRLAPYNTHYPTLDAQISQSKLQTNLASNLWNSPLIFKVPGSGGQEEADSVPAKQTTTTTTTTTASAASPSTADPRTCIDTTTTDFKNLNIANANANANANTITDSNTQSSIYSIIDPDDFYPFSVPFVLKGKTKSNPCELPTKYIKSLACKTNSIQLLHKMIQQSTPDQKIRGHIMHLVESKFQDWLIDTDNIRQINDLINMKR